MFDALEGRAYENDRQILHFEGVRVDMEKAAKLFTLEFGSEKGLELHELVEERKVTCCYAEVGKLPMPEPETVKVTWVDF